MSECLCLVGTLLGSALVSAGVGRFPFIHFGMIDDDASSSPKSGAIAVALAAALLIAIDGVVLRSMSVGERRVPPLVTAFWYGFLGAALLGGAMLATGQRLSVPTRGAQKFLLIGACFDQCAIVLVNVLAAE